MAFRLSTGLRNQLLGLSGGTPEGGGFGEIFTKCVIKVYTAPRPATADAAETGTLLLTLTDDGGDYTPADGTNGLDWDDPDAGVLSKSSTQTWKGTGANNGTPAWARIYPVGASVEGASTTVPRLDMSAGVAPGDCQLLGTVTQGVDQTANSCNITMPSGV